jgi:hypothetical protein
MACGLGLSHRAAQRNMGSGHMTSASASAAHGGRHHGPTAGCRDERWAASSSLQLGDGWRHGRRLAYGLAVGRWAGGVRAGGPRLPAKEMCPTRSNGPDGSSTLWEEVRNKA